MGRPQQSSNDAASAPSSSTPQPTTNETSSAVQSSNGTQVSDLPPAAIDLATKLFDYARQGATAELTQYVSAGIPPNLTNQKGDTLLMLAAYHGHADVVRMLLAKGADPDVLNDRGQSPIAGAVFKGHDEVVKALVEGVEVDGTVRKADVYHGQPNAVDSARMFKKEEYLRWMGVQDEA